MKRDEWLEKRKLYKEDVFHGIVNGKTPSEIAKELGLNKRWVYRLAGKVIDEYHAAMSGMAKVHASIDLARIEQMIKAVMPKATNPDKPDKYAIETAIKLLDRKAKLLGLDKPQKVEVDVQMSLSQLVSASMDAIDAEYRPANGPEGSVDQEAMDTPPLPAIGPNRAE
jgi:hypothetical protein